MSYCEIYGIDSTGQVFEWDRIHNPHGWCRPYWQWLAAKYLGRDEPLEDFELVWPLYDDPRLGIDERLMLGATFDRAWVPVGWLHNLATNLASHHIRHGNPSFTPTMLSMAASLARLRFDRASNDRHTMMGVCFNGTSVSQSLWYGQPLPGEEDRQPLININTQPLCYDGKAHFAVEPMTRQFVFKAR